MINRETHKELCEKYQALKVEVKYWKNLAEKLEAELKIWKGTAP